MTHKGPPIDRRPPVYGKSTTSLLSIRILIFFCNKKAFKNHLECFFLLKNTPSVDNIQMVYYQQKTCNIPKIFKRSSIFIRRLKSLISPRKLFNLQNNFKWSPIYWRQSKGLLLMEDLATVFPIIIPNHIFYYKVSKGSFLPPNVLPKGYLFIKDLSFYKRLL